MSGQSHFDLASVVPFWVFIILFEAMNSCKALINRNLIIIGQLTCFSLGKVLLGVVELPNHTKNMDYSILLIITALLYLGAFGFKLYKEGRLLLKSILFVYFKMFLIWIVSILSIIFSFSLSHELDWNMVEIIALNISQVLSTSTLVVLCNWRFVNKIEFIAFEAILGINIIALGIKTVIYLEYDSESPHKDMVLINLTTQVALAILVMDAIERAYAKNYANRPQNNLVEHQMSQVP